MKILHLTNLTTKLFWYFSSFKHLRWTFYNRKKIGTTAEGELNSVLQFVIHNSNTWSARFWFNAHVERFRTLKGTQSKTGTQPPIDHKLSRSFSYQFVIQSILLSIEIYEHMFYIMAIWIDHPLNMNLKTIILFRIMYTCTSYL